MRVGINKSRRRATKRSSRIGSMASNPSGCISFVLARLPPMSRARACLYARPRMTSRPRFLHRGNGRQRSPRREPSRDHRGERAAPGRWIRVPSSTVAYVFGDTARGLYVVGCLALDLFTPLQVHLSFPSLDLITLPSIGLGVIGISYLEVRLYRRLWPASRRREIAQIVERRGREGSADLRRGVRMLRAASG